MRRLTGPGKLAPKYDLVVVGAGPAGMAAASTASERGASVLLVDQARTPGGQIYRSVEQASERLVSILGPDYAKGLNLTRRLAAADVDYLPDATVWFLDASLELGVRCQGTSSSVSAGHVIIATGATERPMPFEGWTLPGVMFAGAGQILLKSSELLPEGRVVFAGSGPLMWLLAAQYLRAGCPPALMLETTPARNRLGALPSLPAFMASENFAKGLGLLRTVRRAVKVVTEVSELRAEAGTDGNALRISYRSGNSKWQATDGNVLMIHQGVVPNPNLARSAGCRFEWNAEQAAFLPSTSPEGFTSVPGISVAGDGARIMGAAAAASSGELVALYACRSLGIGETGEHARLLSATASRMRKASRGRRFIDRFYRPLDAMRRAAGSIIACRCEEVTGNQIATVLAETGACGPNQIKAFLRCGMGPCQGRMCGLTVSETIANIRGQSMDDVGYYTLRPPVVPISLSELAAGTGK